ncbi:MAG TPA: glycosyltransferase, partial [Candidatus Dormibacteraeota bacterium]|nr:glycosyltransferase [Candidatus Dormibacteraeota bacterium]
LAGGAERLAWDLAHGLRRRGHNTTVYTTCADAFSSPWNRDVLAPGLSMYDELPVLRFRVDRVDLNSFRAVNRKLLAANSAGPSRSLRSGSTVLDEAETTRFVRDNIGSSDLVAHLSARARTYDAVLFIPYLYGTTLRAWESVRDRAVIIPCLHDEAYAYLEPIADLMRGAARLLFNSRGEFELARRLFGPGIVPRSHVVGSGIALPAETDPSPVAPGERYLLYLGRWDEGKNVGLIRDSFQRFRELATSSSLTLLFVGEGSDEQHFPSANIRGLGRVSDAERDRLLRNCTALLQPSVNESFSRVVMEAWAVGRPVVVHKDCAVTSDALEETTAGWAAGDAVEWQRAFNAIDAASDLELAELGARASAYIRENASWERVFDRYEEALGELIASRDPDRRRASVRVAQILQHADYGDALTTFALQLDGELRRHGADTFVTAGVVDERLNGVVRHADLNTIETTRLRVVYTPTAGSAESDLRLALTPSAKKGFEVAGAPATRAAPFVDLNRLNIAPDASLMLGLQDGRCNLLAVAPIDASNHQLEIIDVFAQYLAFDFTARLSLVGAVGENEYNRAVQEKIEGLGLEHRILLPGVVSHPALAAFYRTASLFISLRDRYETGLTLLEAMAFDVPLCVRATEDAREILGDAGVLHSDSNRSLELAALWRVLATDAPVRRKILAGQRRRIEQASGDRFTGELLDLLAQHGAPVRG